MISSVLSNEAHCLEYFLLRACSMHAGRIAAQTGSAMTTSNATYPAIESEADGIWSNAKKKSDFIQSTVFYSIYILYKNIIA